MTNFKTKRKKRQNLCEFIWVGKDTCLDCLNEPSEYEFISCPEESINFDTTENLFFECDNLDALKYLQQTHLEKVKCIYIDPPYNTGKKRQYKDDFGDITGCKHSDWLNMMYPRLYLARDLLRDDGVIFISIDDNEVHNLRKICDEIFGEENFVCQICHKNRDGVSNDKIISSNHNFILFYSKDMNTSNQTRDKFGIERDHNDFKNYNKNDNDDKGFYTLNPVTGPGGARKGNPYYEVSGISNYWRYSKERMSEMIKKGQIIKVNNSLYQKTYKDDMIYKKKSITTWWENVGTTARGTKQIKDLFGNCYFDFAKPIDLIKYILKFIPYEDDDIVLDFFSGSATTAHATMQLNAEDDGNRKWIMVQLPELCDEKSETYKAGYKNICEIGKERIRRAGKKVLEEAKYKDIDVGFQVWKVRKKGGTNE